MERGKEPWANERVQLDLVELMFAKLATNAQIVAALKQEHGVGEHRAKKLIAKTKERIIRNDAAESKTRRMRQAANVEMTIRRLDIRIEMAEQEGKMAIGLYQAKARFLEHLSILTGTQQPQEVNVNFNVDVNINEIMVAAIAQMTSEETGKIIEAQKELEENAAAYRQLMQENPVHPDDPPKNF